MGIPRWEAWLSRSNRTGFDEESGAVPKNPTKGQHKTWGVWVSSSGSSIHQGIQTVPRSTCFGFFKRVAAFGPETPRLASNEVAWEGFAVQRKALCDVRVQNDPSFQFTDAAKGAGDRTPQKSAFTVRKTEVNDRPSAKESLRCPIHNTAHELQDCRVFKEKSPDEKIAVLKENRLCFRCLKPNHLIKNCKTGVRCDLCGKAHVTVMHRPAPSHEVPSASNQTPSATGEKENQPWRTVTPKCTRVCGQGREGRSCAKICLAKAYLQEKPERVVTTYVIIDDQSDGSLINENLLDSLEVKLEKSRYAVKTVSGLQEVHGRKLSGLIIESLDGTVCTQTPTLFECNNIPGDVSEIPTPEVAAAFEHLRPIALTLPPLNKDAEIAILLGRDAPQFHKVREVINGKDDQPWAHRLDLGWVVVGEVCLSGAHIRTDITHLRKDVVSTYFTQVLRNGRNSANFQPCENAIEVIHCRPKAPVCKHLFWWTHGSFFRWQRVHWADELRDEKGSCWELVCPIALQKEPPKAKSRMKTLVNSLAKDKRKKEHYFEFMGKILEKKLAKRVHDESTKVGEEAWYLPHFGVYHSECRGRAV